MVMRALIQWRSGGLALMVLGVLLLALQSSENALPADADAKAAALPSDLVKIPSDGTLLFSIRVAELWTGDFLKSVRKKHNEIDQMAQEFQTRFGLPLEQVERLSVAITGVPPGLPNPVIILRARQPYDLAKVLATEPKLKREAYKGKTLYAADKWAVYPLDDRSVAFCESAAEFRSWIDHPQPKEKSALADSLTRAAENHAMVLGVNVQKFYDAVSGDLPPALEPFRPLFLARWASLVVDIGTESRLAIKAQYANEKDAKAAAKPAQSGLALLRAGLDQGIQMLSKDKDQTELASLLKQFRQPMNEMKIDQNGEMLRSSLSAKVDPASAGTVVIEGIQKVRESASRVQSMNNLKQLALAMVNYADATKGRLPAHAIYSKDGKPLLSWRVTILPYLDQLDLYNEFHLNEPWNSEHNKKLLAKMPRVYASPRDEKTIQEHSTYYQCFVGKGAFFEGKQGLRYPADFPDGLSNTLMIVEASKRVPWTKPEDIAYDPAKPLPKLGVPDVSDFLAAICDGSIHTISPKITEQTLRNAITRNDGMPLGQDF